MKASVRLFFITTFLSLFIHAKPEADSCTSNLNLIAPIPFDTTNLHCLPVWKAQGFILRVGAPFFNLITLYLYSNCIIYTNSHTYYFAVCADFCKYLELHSLNPRHKFLHSY